MRLFLLVSGIAIGRPAPTPLGLPPPTKPLSRRLAISPGRPRSIAGFIGVSARALEIGSANPADGPDDLNAHLEKTVAERQRLPRAGQLAEHYPVPVRDRVKIADLKVLHYLRYYRTAAPGAEPDRGELVASLRAGRQPYPAVVADRVVVFGTNLVEAAGAAGRTMVEVLECPDAVGLVNADLGLKAAGLHLQAVVTRTSPAPFDLRLLAAKVYDAWSEHFGRRPPRPRDDARTAEWAVLRASLVRAAFGRSQRSLRRDVRLLHLPFPLLAAVGRANFPESHVEAAAGLGHVAQLELARRLTGGETFADIRDDYFLPAGPRKTKRGAARAIQGCVKTIAAEAVALNGWSPLGAGDYPAARAAVAHLQAWLNVLPPTPIDDVVAAAVGELGPVGGQPNAAIRGGGRAAKGVGA